MRIILPRIEINNISERNYSYYSDLFQYKKKKVVPCCPSCLWYYKNNKNSLGFRLLCNLACIDILRQYERCSFVTSYLSIACGYPKKKHERTLCVGKRKGENGKRSFVSMSSERQTKYGRSSYRLVREQRMLAKRKEQR